MTYFRCAISSTQPGRLKTAGYAVRRGRLAAASHETEVCTRSERLGDRAWIVGLSIS
jgi:hypothetical protein